MQEYGSYAFVKTTTPNLFSKDYKATHQAEIDSLVEKGKDFSVQALPQYYKAMMLREDKTAVLESSGLPVLFIIGEEDNAAPLPDLLKQVHLPALSYIHILEHVGHMGMWEAATEVNGFIADFLKDIVNK